VLVTHAAAALLSGEEEDPHPAVQEIVRAWWAARWHSAEVVEAQGEQSVLFWQRGTRRQVAAQAAALVALLCVNGNVGHRGCHEELVAVGPHHIVLVPTLRPC
jgi:hypothetical protein